MNIHSYINICIFFMYILFYVFFLNLNDVKLLSSSFPTIILYVIDTPRCVSPTTFMSNMLYACSVLYKSQLPLVCIFNKIDVVACDFALEWMADFEAFQEVILQSFIINVIIIIIIIIMIIFMND